MDPAKYNLVQELSRSLNLYFQHKDYGEDVKSIEIGLLMTFTREGYEDWYKPRRLAYIRYKKSKHKLTHEIIEIEKTLKYEIKLTDQQISNYWGSENRLSKETLIDEILRSLSVFDKLPKAVKDFDVERLKNDLNTFFNTQG